VDLSRGSTGRGYEMKRALLIAGGTVGGLGAVLAITPPQLGGNSSLAISGGASAGTTSTQPTAAASSTPTQSTSSKPVATQKATSRPVATKSATPVATKSATPTPAATKSTPAVTSTVKDGTFTGPSVFVKYGNVQVKITVSNGKITDAVAVQAPSGRNDRYTNRAVPILKAQTLQAQSANIQGASGASYTSYGWFKSLQGALADAGF
jgi:uncharacterized protein with FMN-binding domain